MAVIVRKVKDVPPADLGSDEDMKGVELLPLITEREGAGHFAMRLLRVAPGGYTPLHEHPWEHEVYVFRGSGEVVAGDGSLPIVPGTAVFVPAGDRHRFRAGVEGLDFLCCIPLSGPKG
jgi:quercetin dioxygenase-like cupin family protein